MIKNKLAVVSVFIVIAFTLASCATTTAQGNTIDQIPADYAKTHFIGIALEYQEKGSEHYLEGAINDVIEFGSLYSQIAEMKGIDHTETYLIYSQEENAPYDAGTPSARNIIKTITDLDVDSEDNVIIYFSGHTAHATDNDQLVVAGEGPMIDMPQVISYRNFFYYLGLIDCHVTLLLETCAPSEIAGYIKSDNVSVLISSSGGEPSRARYFLGIGQYHGLFGYGLLESLGWKHTSKVTRTVVSGNRGYEAEGTLNSDIDSALPLSELLAGIEDTFGIRRRIAVQKPVIRGENAELLYAV